MSLEVLQRQAAAGASPEESAAWAARMLDGAEEGCLDEDVRQMAVRVASGTVVHAGPTTVDSPRMRGARLLAALLLALPGEGVHLLTPTEASAEAEARAARQLYRPLGVTVGVLRTDMSPPERRAAYACDITIGTYTCFGTDRLHDPQALDIADRTRGDAPAAVICDTDQVLIRNHNNRLCLKREGPPPPPALLRGAARHAAGMVEGRDFTAAADQGLPPITAHGRKALHDTFGVVHPTSLSTLLLEKRVAEALLARSALRGKDYDLADSQVVRRGSSRLPDGIPFVGGLRQAIEAKEGVPVTETWWITEITSVQTCIARYRLVGGTAHSELLLAGHLAELFGLRVWDRRTPQQAKAEHDRAAELDHHLSVVHVFDRWHAPADRYRAEFCALRERTRDPAGLTAVVEELTGRQVAGADPTLRADVHAGLDKVLGYLNMTEWYEWSVHWPDGLSDHEQALADLVDALRTDLRTALTRRLVDPATR